MKLPKAETLTVLVPAAAHLLQPSRRLSSGLPALAAAALVLGAGLVLPLAVWAQDDGARTGLQVQTSLGLSLSATDNLTLSATAPDAALITAVTPRVAVTSGSGRLRGNLDYALSGVLYTKSDQRPQVLHSLAGQGVAELIENSFYVDMRASIGQQALSAFGAQSTDATLSNPNRVQVGTLAISPYLLGRIGNFASVQLRANAQETRAEDSLAGDSRGSGGSLRLDGVNTGRLSWWALASTQKSESGLTQVAYTNSLLNLGLRYRPDVDFDLSINGGPERNDYGGGGTRKGANYGVGVNWTPTPRTKIAGDYQYHEYGNSHTLSIEHRLAQSSFRYVDTQSVTLGDQNNGLGGPRTNYELMSLLLSGIADPVQRDTLARAELQKLGLNPDSSLGNAFLSSAPALSRRQEFAMVMTGRRLSFTATLNRTLTNRLSPVPLGGGDLAQNARIVTHGASVSAAYRLTPTSNTSLTLSDLRARGDTAALSSNLRSFSVNWTANLAPRLSVSLGARHAEFDGYASSYSENAVFATLLQQF